MLTSAAGHCPNKMMSKVIISQNNMIMTLKSLSAPYYSTVLTWGFTHILVSNACQQMNSPTHGLL